MEQNGNQNLPPVILCRTGCGFYGNPAFDGLCSKCYKDALKRKNNSSSPVSSASGRMSPVTPIGLSEKADSSVSSVTSTLAHATIGNSSPDCGSPSDVQNSTTPSVETATPTVAMPGSSPTKSDTSQEEGAAGGSAAAADISDSASSNSDEDKKPKKNRCHTCKKKVGLTGFPCRCGGLYCSMHRYSDKHECSFNYKEMAQEHIRKQNPVIVADKIQKI